MAGPGHLGWEANRFGRRHTRWVTTDRQPHREGAPLDRGWSTKIPLVVDRAGRVLAFAVMPGQMGNLRTTHGLLANLSHLLSPPLMLPTTATACATSCSGAAPRLSSRKSPTRKNRHSFEECAYKARNIIECTKWAAAGLAPRPYPL